MCVVCGNVISYGNDLHEKHEANCPRVQSEYWCGNHIYYVLIVKFAASMISYPASLLPVALTYTRQA